MTLGLIALIPVLVIVGPVLASALIARYNGVGWTGGAGLTGGIGVLVGMSVLAAAWAFSLAWQRGTR
ncbi:hypothetical protein [Nocardia lasii]|uniref:DUF4190 domain-containing protein n=1 Tax=Nocardia lasii TaxID=1616107 RepID=A0ABW1JRP4_9NOCA